MSVWRGILIATVICFSCLSPGAPKPHSQPAGIFWDKWGVPHIYAQHDVDAFRAFGWAQMHNHGDLILHLYAQARGNAAQYFGPDDLVSDRAVHTMGIYHFAEQWYAQQPPWFRSDLNAFAEGINLYAQQHSAKLAPAGLQILPVRGVDVLAYAIREIWLFQAGISGCTAVIPSGGSLGSNGWAIAPAHSENGHAMLLANPHLPWEGEMLFFEAHINTPDYVAYGATLVGLPVLAIAFNQNLGWTHTVNTIHPCDLYRLTTKDNGYVLDGKVHAFQSHTEDLKIRQPDGTTKTENLVIRQSIQGPVIDAGGKLLAVRDAGLQAGSFAGFLQQWWEMGQAHNWKEFQHAVRRMQVPLFNIVYADRQGNAFALYGGQIPKHSQGDFAFWSQPVPGDTSKTLWNQVMTYDDVPKSFDPPSGWVQNSNSAPWYMTEPVLDAGKFPSDVAPSPATPGGWPSPREQRGIRMLTEVKKMSYEQLVADKFSAHSETADRLLNDLVAAANRQGSDLAKRAAQVLNSWDRTSNSSSRGSVLFLAWIRLSLEHGRISTVPFDPADLLNTPRGLRDPAQALHDLEAAASQVQSAYGSLDIAWGDVFRLKRGTYDLPASGGPNGLGNFRVIDYEPDKTGHFLSAGGDSFVAAVEFSTPLKANVLLTYGNSSDPKSPHFGDQLELYSKNQLRPALLSLQDVKAQAVDTETIPAAAPEQSTH